MLYQCISLTLLSQQTVFHTDSMLSAHWLLHIGIAIPNFSIQWISKAYIYQFIIFTSNQYPNQCRPIKIGSQNAIFTKQTLDMYIETQIFSIDKRVKMDVVICASNDELLKFWLTKMFSPSKKEQNPSKDVICYASRNGSMPNDTPKCFWYEIKSHEYQLS